MPRLDLRCVLAADLAYLSTLSLALKLEQRNQDRKRHSVLGVLLLVVVEHTCPERGLIRLLLPPNEDRGVVAALGLRVDKSACKQTPVGDAFRGPPCWTGAGEPSTSATR